MGVGFGKRLVVLDGLFDRGEALGRSTGLREQAGLIVQRAREVGQEPLAIDCDALAVVSDGEIGKQAREMQETMSVGSEAEVCACGAGSWAERKSRSGQRGEEVLALSAGFDRARDERAEALIERRPDLGAEVGATLAYAHEDGECLADLAVALQVQHGCDQLGACAQLTCDERLSQWVWVERDDRRRGAEIAGSVKAAEPRPDGSLTLIGGVRQAGNDIDEGERLSLVVRADERRDRDRRALEVRIEHELSTVGRLLPVACLMTVDQLQHELLFVEPVDVHVWVLACKERSTRDEQRARVVLRTQRCPRADRGAVGQVLRERSRSATEERVSVEILCRQTKRLSVREQRSKLLGRGATSEKSLQLAPLKRLAADKHDPSWRPPWSALQLAQQLARHLRPGLCVVDCDEQPARPLR